MHVLSCFVQLNIVLFNLLCVVKDGDRRRRRQTETETEEDEDRLTLGTSEVAAPLQLTTPRVTKTELEVKVKEWIERPR